MQDLAHQTVHAMADAITEVTDLRAKAAAGDPTAIAELAAAASTEGSKVRSHAERNAS
jgi:hypothetical protein